MQNPLSDFGWNYRCCQSNTLPRPFMTLTETLPSDAIDTLGHHYHHALPRLTCCGRSHSQYDGDDGVRIEYYQSLQHFVRPHSRRTSAQSWNLPCSLVLCRTRLSLLDRAREFDSRITFGSIRVGSYRSRCWTRKDQATNGLQHYQRPRL